MHMKNKKLVLAILTYILIDVLSRLIYNFYILNESVLKTYYLNEFSSSVAEEKLSHINDNMFLGLLLAELFVIVKFLLITLLLKTGSFLLGFKNVVFKKVLYIVVLSYCVFLIPGLLQITWFGLFVERYTVEDLSNFNWHTLFFWMNDLNYDFLKYPLSVINLYELLFWFFLIYLLKRKLEISSWNSIKLVFISYGLSLFIWIVFVVFMMVTIS